MTAIHRRRGACPSLSAPMPTGDGLLARLMPIEPVPLEAMVEFCAAARRHGNGTIEISARGSLQVRGLTLHTAPLFAAAMVDLGIAAQGGVPVIAGFDDGGVDGMAAELLRAIADARLALSAKVSVVVDGEGALHLDALSADVRLRAVQSEQGLQWYLGIAGGNRSERAAASGNGPSIIWLGVVEPKDAVDAVTDILKTIAADGPMARAADIFTREGVEAFPAAVVKPASPPLPRMPSEMIGHHAMRNGTIALGVGLAFGHTDAETLTELVRIAACQGAHVVRPVPDRVLLLIGLSASHARDMAAVAARLGFVVHPDDPRRRIAACAGAPACASGLIPARTIAAVLAQAIGPVLKSARGGVVVHISGCPKGCAHPAPAALTLVGTPQGCGVVHGGSARAVPHDFVDPTSLGDTISCVAAKSRDAVHG